MNASALQAVPLLARVWQEDDVWNVSAFDLPIVAYGEHLEDARRNFEEAVRSHFEALAHLQRLHETTDKLRHLAQTREFYAERITPHTLVESFPVNPDAIAA